MARHITLVFLSVLSWARGFTDCDHFHFGVICSFYPPSNIKGALPDVGTEIACQAECSITAGCGNFTFERFTSGGSQCFLFHSCNTSELSCGQDPDCLLSVSGPVSPDITEACCDAFTDSACGRDSELAEIFHVLTAEQCQELCRDELLLLDTTG